MLLHDPLSPAKPGRLTRAACASREADGYGGVLTIDLAAIWWNYCQLASRAAAGVVKADAYGLGVAEVAPALYAEGCRTFFVAHVEEGVQLRAILGQDATIFVLHGPPPGSELACIAHALTPVLNGAEQLAAWLHVAALHRSLGACALQFDTGMTRFGFDPEGAAFVAQAKMQPCLVMSHLACTDEAGNPANRRQLDRILALDTRSFPGGPVQPSRLVSPLVRACTPLAS